MCVSLAFGCSRGEEDAATKGRSAADWASRALLALDAESDSDEEEEDAVEADMQLVKLTGAIAKKILRLKAQ